MSSTQLGHKIISVVGLGKLGLPFCAAAASRGYEVIAYDLDHRKLASYEAGNYPFETSLDELMQKHGSRIRFTRDLEDLLSSSITFFIVPTPSLEDGTFSNFYLIQAFQAFSESLRSKKDFHLMSIMSTVMPGSFVQFESLIEGMSGKTCGKDFGLCYNPAFIALGNVIQNFLKPDFILIGESDSKSGDSLQNFFNSFCFNPPLVRRMNYVNAELTKISVNAFVTMKISFANTLARICEKLPGADSKVVAQAVGSDKRIGTAYLQGAVGYGGPCFPRDNRAFQQAALKAGTHAALAEATDKVNQAQALFLADLVKSALKDPKDTIGILGLSYKPDTDVIEESQGILLAKLLSGMGFTVIVHDPVSLENAKRILPGDVMRESSLENCLEKSEILVLATPWKEYKKICLLLNETGSKNKTIIDCWRFLHEESSQFPNGISYNPLGLYQVKEILEVEA